MKKFNTVLTFGALFCLSILVMPTVVGAASLYRELQVGSRGSDVSDLQAFLAADSSIYPQGLITGYFGSLTAAAVRRFQARNGISQVGRVGPQTMATINEQMGSTPVVSNMSAPSFTSANAVVNGSVTTFLLTTNVPTRATVFYSSSPLVASENLNVNPITVSVSGTGIRSDMDLRTSHSISSLALGSNTRYYAMMVVADASGMVSVHPFTFQTTSF